MAALNIGAMAQQRHHLLDLPQELQVMIFHDAYSRSSNVALITAEEWHSREQSKQRSLRDGQIYTRQPFPASKVNEFIVSKYFFAMAAKTYATSRPVHHRTILLSASHFENIFCLFASEVSCSFLPVWHFGYTFNLRSLTVKLGTWAFQIGWHAQGERDRYDDEGRFIEDDWALNRLFTGDDFLRLVKLNEGFRCVKGLTSFRLVCGDDLSDCRGSPATAAQKEIFTTNVKAYETCLMAEVTSPVSPNSQAYRVPMTTSWLASANNSSPKTFADKRSQKPLHCLHGQDQTAAPPGIRKSSYALRVTSPASPLLSTQGATTNARAKRKFTEDDTSPHTNASRKWSKRPPIAVFLQSLSKRAQAANADPSTECSTHCNTPVASGEDNETDALPSASPTLALKSALAGTSLKDLLSRHQGLIIADQSNLSPVLGQLERLLDADDPDMVGWVTEMRRKGKL